MTTRQAFLEFPELQAKLQKDYARLGNLRAISRIIYGGRVTYGTIGRAIKGIEPKQRKAREELGLSPMGLVPVCRDCGEPHPAKRCPKKRKYRSLFDLPVEELARRLKEREEI